jgi:hypothetical protein
MQPLKQCIPYIDRRSSLLNVALNKHILQQNWLKKINVLDFKKSSMILNKNQFAVCK